MADERPIERALFREAEDGSTVFHPWGPTRGGYRLPDEGARRRAARAASLLVGSTVAIGTWTAHRLHGLFGSSPEAPAPGALMEALALPAAAMACVLVGYWLWVARFVEPFAPSDSRPSREELLREAARQVPPWKLTAIGVVTCGLSGLLVWLEPRAGWLGLAGAAVGVGLVAWSRAVGRAASRSL